MLGEKPAKAPKMSAPAEKCKKWKWKRRRRRNKLVKSNWEEAEGNGLQIKLWTFWGKGIFLQKKNGTMANSFVKKSHIINNYYLFYLYYSQPKVEKQQGTKQSDGGDSL